MEIWTHHGEEEERKKSIYVPTLGVKGDMVKREGQQLGFLRPYT